MRKLGPRRRAGISADEVKLSWVLWEYSRSQSMFNFLCPLSIPSRAFCSGRIIPSVRTTFHRSAELICKPCRVHFGGTVCDSLLAQRKCRRVRIVLSGRRRGWRDDAVVAVGEINSRRGVTCRSLAVHYLSTTHSVTVSFRALPLVSADCSVGHRLGGPR